MMSPRAKLRPGASDTTLLRPPGGGLLLLPRPAPAGRRPRECAWLLVLAWRLVPGRVLARDAVGFPVGSVAAAIYRDDGRSDPLLELLDLKTILHFLRRFHGETSFGEIRNPSVERPARAGRSTDAESLLAAGRVVVTGAGGGRSGSRLLPGRLVP